MAKTWALRQCRALVTHSVCLCLRRGPSTANTEHRSGRFELLLSVLLACRWAAPMLMSHILVRSVSGAKSPTLLARGRPLARSGARCK